MAIALRSAAPAAACITQRLINAGQPLGQPKLPRDEAKLNMAELFASAFSD